MSIQDQNQDNGMRGRPVRSAAQQAAVDKNDQIIYAAGDTIEFMLPDGKGNANWFPGKIHGVKTIEDPATHLILSVTYLVDTGRDERVDEYPIDVRGREIDKRVEKLRKEGKTTMEAAVEVAKHKDLPDFKVVTETVRQPLQIELPESAIRKA